MNVAIPLPEKKLKYIESLLREGEKFICYKIVDKTIVKRKCLRIEVCIEKPDGESYVINLPFGNGKTVKL